MARSISPSTKACAGALISSSFRPRGWGTSRTSKSPWASISSLQSSVSMPVFSTARAHCLNNRYKPPSLLSLSRFTSWVERISRLPSGETRAFMVGSVIGVGTPAVSAMTDFEPLRRKGTLSAFRLLRYPTFLRSKSFFMKLLIRPAAEVAIKSKPVRQQQMRQLRQNIRKILVRLDPEIRVDGSWDRVDIEVPEGRGLASPVIDELTRIPGISTIQEIGVFPFVDIADVSAKAIDAYADRLKGKTFVVRARRLGDHDFRSIVLERAVGGALLQASDARGVDLKNPEMEVRIEVKDDQYHIAHRRHEGAGGYPIGTVETVM